MKYAISEIKLEELAGYYRPGRNALRWPVPFVLPGWMEAWWASFGAGYEPLVIVVRENDTLIGIAPLKVKGGDASLIGDNSVCDYLDFITAPYKENEFAGQLFDYLANGGVRSLVLETLRPDSIAIFNIAHEAKRRRMQITYSPIDVSFEMELSETWEGYLASLDGKQRRDLERKMRQLENMAEVRFSVLNDAAITQSDLDLFFTMMAESRSDKAEFMTSDMRSYFQTLTSAMSYYGAVRLGILNVGVERVAVILYFEYNDRIYLYNSGYASQYAEMNVGLISKLYCIRKAIHDQYKVFDLLKGPEVYKSRLGGHEIELSRCVIYLSST